MSYALRRVEHALQGRLGDLGEGRADFALLGGRHPVGLDRRHAGLADAAQQRLAQIAVLDGGSGMIVQAAADLFGMLPAPEHARRALPHELGAGIR